MSERSFSFLVEVAPWSLVSGFQMPDTVVLPDAVFSVRTARVVDSAKLRNSGHRVSTFWTIRSTKTLADSDLKLKTLLPDFQSSCLLLFTHQ